MHLYMMIGHACLQMALPQTASNKLTDSVKHLAFIILFHANYHLYILYNTVLGLVDYFP